jgi:hypothetical protein
MWVAASSLAARPRVMVTRAERGKVMENTKLITGTGEDIEVTRDYLTDRLCEAMQANDQDALAVYNAIGIVAFHPQELVMVQLNALRKFRDIGGHSEAELLDAAIEALEAILAGKLAA